MICIGLKKSNKIVITNEKTGEKITIILRGCNRYEHAAIGLIDDPKNYIITREQNDIQNKC